MANDGTVKIKLELDTSLADEQAKQVGNKYGKQITEQINSQAQSASTTAKQAISDIGSQMESYGASYTKAVTLPILAAGGATVAAAVNIDTALTGVRKTVDGTEEQYEALKQAAIEFSQTNAVDPAQILDIQALGAQLGYTITELDMFGEVVSGLDIATNMQAEEAAVELAQFANIMGMAHSETKNYGSTIVELGNNFATTEADISHMAMRIAGAGKQIGLSEADVLGLATALSSMGINAEAGGTAISTIMSQIDKAVAKNSDSLKTWAAAAGMSADEFAKAWGEDAVGALSSVLIGMDAATQEGGNMALMLDELGINSIRQTDTLKRLANNSEFLGKAVSTANRAWQENVALDKEVENRNNSMAAQFEILKNKATAVAVEIGEPLANALIAIIDNAQPLIDALASGAKAFGDLDENGQRLVLTALAVVAAIGPLSSVTGKLIKTATGSSAAWKRLSADISAIRSGFSSYTASVNKAAAAQSNYKTIMVGGQQAIVRYDAAMKKMVVVQSATTTATKAQTVAMKANEVALKAGAAAMGVVRNAANLLKGALASIAPVAVLTAAISLFTAISDKISGATEQADKYRKATEGIVSANGAYAESFNKARSAADNASTGVDNYSNKLEGLHDRVNETINKQAELADSLNDLWSDTGTNNAMVQTYAETIKKLTDNYDENGNKAKLTAEQQAELHAAVDGLNSILGTTYKVIDDENGVLDVNTRLIEENARAWQNKAIQEAASQANTELMKQQIELRNQQRDATQALEQAEHDYYVAMAEGRPEAESMIGSVEYAKGELYKVEEQLNANEQAIKNNNETVKEMNDELDHSIDSLRDYIESSAEWSEAISASGISLDDVLLKLTDLGIGVSDLSEVFKEKGQEGIDGFIAAYQGGIETLIPWMRENGIQIPENLAAGIEEGKPEATGAANDVKQGVEATLADARTRILGAIGSSEYAAGFGSNTDKTKRAAEEHTTEAKSILRDTDSKTWGFHLGSQWANGISSAVSVGSGAARTLMDSVSRILKFSVPKEGVFSGAEKGGETSGRHLGENFARGLASTDSLMAAAAEKGLNAVRNSYGEAGISLADEFVSGFETANPLGQIEESISKGISVQAYISGLNSQTPSEKTTYIDNTKEITIVGDVNSPDIINRKMRMEQRYGLTGNYSR